MPEAPHIFGWVLDEYKRRPKNQRSLRLGQWYMNNFDPSNNFSLLYYETDTKKALGMIHVLYYTSDKELREFIERRGK